MLLFHLYNLEASGTLSSVEIHCTLLWNNATVKFLKENAYGFKARRCREIHHYSILNGAERIRFFL